jgi:hypothetical protein
MATVAGMHLTRSALAGIRDLGISKEQARQVIERLDASEFV